MAVWAAGWRNQREIGDPTEVEKSSPPSDASDEGGVRARHKGGSLPPQRQVCGSKIVHHRLVEQLGQKWSLQRLPAGAPSPLLRRSVPQGLTMATHEFAFPVRIAGQGRLRLLFGNGLNEIKPCRSGEQLSLACMNNPSLQSGWIRVMAMPQHAPLWPWC